MDMVDIPSGNDEQFAIEHGYFIGNSPSKKNVIFLSYVSLPEGVMLMMLMMLMIMKRMLLSILTHTHTHTSTYITTYMYNE